MTWATPKTDWNTDYVPDADDMNRIEENTRILGNGGSAGYPDIAAGNSLAITNGAAFHVTGGSTNIYYIATGGVVAGSVIRLISDSDQTIHHLQGAPGAGYAQVHSPSGADVTMYANRIYTFLYTGSLWIISKDGF